MFSSPTTAEPFSSRSAGVVSVPVAWRRAVRVSRSTGTLAVDVVEDELGQPLADAPRGGTPLGLGRARACASPPPSGDNLAERFELLRKAAADVLAEREDALVGDRVVGVVADLP